MRLTHCADRAGKLITFLRGELSLSGGLTQRLTKARAFQINGVTASPYHPVRPGDLLTVTLEEAPPAYPPEEGPLSILYEDEALLVLDKSAGITMHPTSARPTGTLANRLAAYYRRTGQRCGVHFVSRLDRDTFGLVLVAKNAYVHARLAGGALEKTYRAVVYGVPPQAAGEISQPIGRMAGEPLLRGVQTDGQPALTTYRLLSRQDPRALLELHPVTGRTNQLRVHCAWMGCPILGDSQYGTEASQAYSLAHGIVGQRLCAVSLAFPHPLTGARLEVHTRQQVRLEDLP